MKSNPASIREPVLTLDNISKSHDRRGILDRVSASFHTGHLTAILGPRGSGKSSLAAILAGQRLPDRGTVVRTGSVAPIIGAAWGFGHSDRVERDLALRAAVYGCDSRSYIRAIAELIDDPSILGRPFEVVKGFQRALLTFGASYLIPSDLYVADGALFPLAPELHSLLAPLLEASRQRAAIILLTSSPNALRHLDAERLALLTHGQLCFQPDLETTLDKFEAHRATASTMTR